MLVISREVGQTFYVGEDIEISIEGIDSGQVRIGISAPRDVIIARKELIENSSGDNDREDIAKIRKAVNYKRKDAV